jgi:hypothetical protein
LIRCIKHIYTVVGTELYVFGFLAFRKKMHVKSTQSPLTRCDVRIHVLVWDRHNNVAGLNWLKDYLPSLLLTSSPSRACVWSQRCNILVLILHAFFLDQISRYCFRRNLNFNILMKSEGQGNHLLLILKSTRDVSKKTKYEHTEELWILTNDASNNHCPNCIVLQTKIHVTFIYTD